VRAVEDEIEGTRTPSENELSGITFYTADPKRTRVTIREAEVRNLVANPPDETGRLSVSFPLRRLPPLPPG
jgi:hypothetical protein